MKLNLFKALLLLAVTFCTQALYPQCSCSVLSPNSITTINNYTCVFRADSIRLTVSRPLGDSTLWYTINGTDTVKIGSGTSILVGPDTTRRYLSRNILTCYCAGPSQSTVYSSYITTTIRIDTTVANAGATLLLVNNDPVLCNGTSTDVSIYAVGRNSSVTLTRDNTTNVTAGTGMWAGMTNAYRIPLTNATSSSQNVTLTFTPYNNSCLGTPQKTQATVLPAPSSSNSKCYAPAVPAEYGGAFTAWVYRGGTLQLWAGNPIIAVDEREWYKVKGRDTTYIGSGDTVAITPDTICTYIARNKNYCSCSDSTHSIYYSQYALMATINAIQDTPTKPTLDITYSPIVCSGSPTSIYAYANAKDYGYNIIDPMIAFYRDDTANVSGPATGTFYQTPYLGVTLKNKTSIPQRVRFLLRSYPRFGGCWSDDKVIYITVLPDTAQPGDGCKYPATPGNMLFTYGDAYTYAKGAHIQYSVDTNIVASEVLWYKVLGTDTSYIGSGYTINIVMDTSCKYLVRNRNACTCSGGSYYSSYLQYAYINVVPVTRFLNWTPLEYVTTIASGTPFNVVPAADTNVLNISIIRDNPSITGVTGTNISYTYFSQPQMGSVLTNTTNVTQRVKYVIRASYNGIFYNSYTGYITVLPSSVTARPGSRCKIPQQHTPYWQGPYISKGATVNLDLNGPGYSGGYGALRNNADSVDFIDWYKTRGRGDTIFVGTTSVNLLGSISPISPPVNIVADTNFTLFTISRNVCYWSDSSVHIYKGGISVIANIVPLTQPLYTLSLTNNKPYIKSGTATNMAISSNGDHYYWYRSNQDKVSGVNGYGSASGIRSGSIIDTLINLTNVPQLVYFAAYAHNNSCGSHVITSVIVYPTSEAWLTNQSIVIKSTRDTVCNGDSVILSADTLAGTVLQWFKGTCGGKGSNYIGVGPFIKVKIDSTTSYYARYRDYCTLNDTTAVDSIISSCSSRGIRTYYSGAAPNVSAIINHTRDNAKGAIYLNATGGMPPYKYIWTDVGFVIDSSDIIDSATAGVVDDNTYTVSNHVGIDTGWYKVDVSDSICYKTNFNIHIGKEAGWICALGILPSHDYSRDSLGWVSNQGQLTKVDTTNVWNTGIFLGYKPLAATQQGEFEITGITQGAHFEQYGGISAFDSIYMSGVTDLGNPTSSFTTVKKYFFYFKDNNYYTIDQDGLSSSLGDSRLHKQFKVCKSATQVTYVVDGAIIKTVSISQPIPLYGGGGILTSGGYFKARFVSY